MSAPILVVDTEGSGLYPDAGARASVVSWATRDEHGELEAGALPFGQGPQGQLFDGPVDAGLEAWELFLDRCERSRLVFHNAAHDLQELQAGAVPGYPGRSLIDAFEWDTSVAQRHLDPLEKVGLEPSAMRRLGVAAWKWRIDAYKATALKVARRLGDFESDQRYDLIPWAQIDAYATEDAVHTLGLYEDQVARFEAGEGDREILDREHNVTRVLFRMETRGVGFASDECSAAAKVLEKSVRAAATGLPRGLRPPTPARICAYFYDHLGYRPTKRDKDGNEVRSADELSRKGLRDQGAPWIDELDEWARLETALTSWYAPWPRATGADGRLRMRVRQTKVTSGRFSGERANLLAIPHDDKLPPGVPTIRSFIRPAPGKMLFEVDLSQAEPRVGAVAVGCEPLVRAYIEGHDAYAVTALDVFGIANCPEHPGKEAEPGCERCYEFDHYRGLCKRIVLSTMYAGGKSTLIRTVKQFMGIDLSDADADRFLTSFRGTYPEFKRAEREWKVFAERHGYVKLALGERRYFQPYEESYKALNQRIQGSVAVVMKPCMVEVDEKFPGALLLQTHDSLLLELDDEEPAHESARIMERTFSDVFGIPFIADIKEWH